MLSKKQFCEFIEKYRTQDDKETELNNALTKYCGEPVDIYSGGLGLALDVVIEAMNDTSHNLIVSFIYDSEYGKREKESHYVIKGKEYNIDSAEKLYDVLEELANV